MAQLHLISIFPFFSRGKIIIPSPGQYSRDHQCLKLPLMFLLGIETTSSWEEINSISPVSFILPPLVLIIQLKINLAERLILSILLLDLYGLFNLKMHDDAPSLLTNFFQNSSKIMLNSIRTT